MLLIIVLLSNIYSEEQEANISDYIVSAGEIFYINGTIAVLDKAINNTNYALFNLDEIKNNFNSSWVWDNSHFLRNQLAHPYFGSLYFNSARSNNISFFPSLLYTASGSFIWEFFIENGNISINDLITTTFSGAITGEILYRLSCEAFGYFKPLSWIINPFGSLNNFIRNQEFQPTTNIYNFSVYTGAGLYNYNFFFDPEDLNTENLINFPDFNCGFNIIYNNPYGHKTKEILDQFEIVSKFNAGNSNNLFSIDFDGTLYSLPVYLNNSFLSAIGLSANYNILYSDKVFYSNNSYGLLFNLYYDFNKNSSFGLVSEINYSLLGTTDNYYIYQNDTKINFSPSELNYTYNNGPEIILKINFTDDTIGNLSVKNKFLVLFPWNNSFSDSKKDCITFTDSFYVNYEHLIFSNFYLGIADNLIFKKTIFTDCDDTYQFINNFGVYLKYKIK